MGLEFLFRMLKHYTLHALTSFVCLCAINASMLSFLSCSITNTFHILYDTYKILFSARISPNFSSIFIEYCLKCKEA